MANLEEFRELRGHNIEKGTIVIYRYDPENQASEQEAEFVAGEVKKANPHWEGPFLVLPTDHSIETMGEAMARSLYARLHKVFGGEVESADEVASVRDDDSGE